MSSRREARLSANYSDAVVLSDSMYNLAMSGIILYGLIVNLFLCTFCSDFIYNVNYNTFLIAYFVCCIGGIFLSSVSRSATVSFIGYNLVIVPMGLLLSMTVELYGGVDASVVREAFLYTVIITLCMVVLSTVHPRFFASLGGVLFTSLIGIIVCEIICMLFGFSQIITSWIAAVIFSLYIGFDFWRSQQFVHTLDNAVDCALDIYLDIINLFVRLLSILGKRDD